MSLNAALAFEPSMTVHSDLLGPLTVAPEDVVRFPSGLFGFPECREFVLVPGSREGTYWLQSVEHGTLAFLLVDPFLFFDDYAVDLGAADRAELEVEEASDVMVLTIVTLPRTRREPPTTNLQGPLALNLRSRKGKQVAISERDLGLRVPVDLSKPVGG